MRTRSEPAWYVGRGGPEGRYVSAKSVQCQARICEKKKALGHKQSQVDQYLVE